MDSKSKKTFVSEKMNENDDIGTLKEPLFIEFQTVKVEQGYEEKMIDGSYFGMEKEDDCFCVKDPLANTMKTDIKIENIEEEEKDESVFQEHDIEKDIAVNIHCSRCSLGKCFKGTEEIGALNCNDCYKNMNDNQPNDCINCLASSYSFGKVVSAVNDGPEVIPISNSISVTSNTISMKIDEPVEVSNSEHAETEERPFVCNVCVKSFGRLHHLKEHMLMHTGEKPYACDLCDKSYTRSDSLKGHRRTHTGEKPFLCDICEKSFSRLDVLKEHKRTHTGDKPFVCDICKKSFSYLSNLKAHRRNHTGKKPFVCDDCKKSFNCLSHLNVHMRSHTGEKPFVCDVCEKSFTILSNLKQHSLIHSGYKPLVCKVCGKSFTRSHIFKRHKITHTGEKPFKCDVCEKSFAILCNLKKHIHVHREKSFVCDVCEKSFSQLHALKKHMRTHIT